MDDTKIPKKQYYGILHGTYKTEYSKEGFATYSCGIFHNGVMLITPNRKEMRKHMMRVHSGYNV